MNRVQRSTHGSKPYAEIVEFSTPRTGDALIAVSLLVLTVAGILTIQSYDLVPGRDHDLWGWLLVGGMSLPLAWRFRYPRAVLWFVFLAWAATVSLGYTDSTGIFGVIVAMYGVGLYLRRAEALRQGGTVVLLAVVWTTIGTLTDPNVHVLSIVSVIIAFTLPLLIGLVDNRRHARLTELEVAHSRREQAKQAAAHDAVRAERARIARELHDVVAHEMTVMTLQAEGAKRRATADTDPAVSAALTTISESGRRGLTEMQRMIGVLRASEQEAVTASEEDETAAGFSTPADCGAYFDDLSPMPSLAGLPTLAQKVEDSGLPVHLEVTGTSHVPAGVELSAYRIVQEALTNAMKHAGPGATAQVRVHREHGQVTVDVEDDGRGVISEAARSSGGHGIAGMRERVAALGGDFDHGPRTGGGYRVRAVLPSSDDQVARRRRERSVGTVTTDGAQS